jgi:N6-adenosine-specific RNA methylase IME4
MPEPALVFHPLSGLFPPIEGAEFDALVADIRQYGVREPVVLYEGAILDGRNRYRAACEADVPCPTRIFAGEDPLGYVISLNLKRRHLNESQRAMVAARLVNLPAHRPPSKDESANLPTSPVSQPVAATMLNVSERLLRSAKAVQQGAAPELIAAVEQGRLAVSVAAHAAKLSSQDQREIARCAKSGDASIVRKTVKQRLRGELEAQLGARQCALPQRRYGVILADPEWRFEPYSRETGMDRSADNHYPTSSLDVIKARDVPSIAADDSVLFLWATVPMLPQALEVMAAWGFDYVSSAVWVKDHIGTCYWFRIRHEILLAGTKGNIPAPAQGLQWDSVIEQPRGVHSAKPEAMCELIEAYFPHLPKIELNRRGPARPGWSVWGNEVAETI